MPFFSHALKLQLVTLTIAALLVAGTIPGAPPAHAAVSLSTEEAAFCTLINNYRSSRGLPPLMVSDSLTRASAWFADDMATNNFTPADHVDSLGRGIKERIEDFGYTYNTYWGENIAWGFESASAAFTWWKNSSSHNANMLNSNFKVIGIGRAFDSSSRYGHYWATDFGGYVDSGAVPCPGGDSTPELPSVSVLDVQVVEGNSTTDETKLLRFKLSLSHLTDAPVRVNYATRNGTATAGSDYVAESGQARIAAGNRTASVAIEIVKDRHVEPNEFLFLDISGPINGVVLDGTGVGTILNDD
ncbi:MAG TPA: CAP domain-containing protein [Actinomycetota bacterium]|nr:CAP domain-containing protein [Actinomycetota bacterium]